MDLRGSDGTNRVKFVLHLEGIDKPMVLNATNKNELVEKLGRKPANWIGALVGLYVDPNVNYAGKRVGGPAPARARPGDDRQDRRGRRSRRRMTAPASRT